MSVPLESSREGVARRVEAVFADIFLAETGPLRKLSRPGSATWDSLGQIQLVTGLEQEFGVALSDEDAVDLNSFAAAVEIILERLADG